ncbi:MAG: energy transducer TonB [Burkholderiales bacterium]|nr:energy transducer TonB [Burkholderiales bacterium]
MIMLSGSARFGISSLASALIHAFLLFGIVFAMPKGNIFKNASPPLEIILVNTKSAAKSKHAEALAQANLAGGGNTEQNRRARSPLPPEYNEDRKADEITLKRDRIAQLEQESRRLLTAIKENDSPSVQSDKQIADTEDLVKKSIEIAKLEAQIDSEMDAYQKIPKETDVSPSTTEYRFARYVEDWRVKVERIGSVNFPEEAKRKRIFGHMLMNVCIRSDGSLDRVQIVRSSGQPVLDEAAIRIAKLAAPYSPLPGNIRKDTDILCIYRTWFFTTSNEMVSK